MAYSRPSEAARVARDGDVIEIDAGTYRGDAAVWRQNDLTLRGTGGVARLVADGASAQGKAIWVIKGNNTRVENIEFRGARVPDGNGAGIRQEGAGLTVRNSWFIDNEAGILAGANADSEILIEDSAFIGNGAGDGYTHNIYIGKIKRFTLRGSYSARAYVGHLVKSRAAENHILFNRLMDEADGNASYLIDIPNGGRTFVIGNVIQQGPQAENPVLLAYAAEKADNPLQALTVVNNTFVNDHGFGVFVMNRSTANVRLQNNIFAGIGVVLRGPGELYNNLATREPGFVDRRHYDYRLAPGSPAIDAGTAVPAEAGMTLVPAFEPGQPSVPRQVIGPIDLGAFEFSGEQRKK